MRRLRRVVRFGKLVLVMMMKEVRWEALRAGERGANGRLVIRLRLCGDARLVRRRRRRKVKLSHMTRMNSLVLHQEGVECLWLRRGEGRVGQGIRREHGRMVGVWGEIGEGWHWRKWEVL